MMNFIRDLRTGENEGFTRPVVTRVKNECGLKATKVK